MSDRSDFDRDYAAFQHDQTVGVVSPGEIRRLLGVAVSLLPPVEAARDTEHVEASDVGPMPDFEASITDSESEPPKRKKKG